MLYITKYSIILLNLILQPIFNKGGIYMFDSFFGNSYIKIKYGETIYVRESVENIRKQMNNSNSYITVTVLDFTGIFDDTKTIQKSEIEDYGGN